MMKPLAGLLILMAGAVAVFAVYTFGWRDSKRDSGDEGRARADAALFLYYQCTYGDEASNCRITLVHHLGGPVWEARALSSKGRACIVVDVNRFAVYTSDDKTAFDRFHAAGWIRC